MDKDRNAMSNKILRFTLEILHLLTGEDYTIVKKTWDECAAPSSHLQESGGWRRAQSPIMDPPPHSLINEQKILELIDRITELLTGKVPIRYQDVAVYFSMEEWEYVEGHKDQYKDVMTEDQQPLISPDGVIDGNPPERCPSPLYSQDCQEENVQENHQGEEITNNKVEDKGEEERRRGDHPCMREVKKEIPEDVNATPENPSKNAWENFMLPPNYKVEDEDITPHFSGENLLTHNVHPGSHSTDLSYDNPSNHEEPAPDQPQILTTKTDPTNRKCYFCDLCGKAFTTKSAVVRHRKIHTGEKMYSRSERGKCFTSKSHRGLYRNIVVMEDHWPLISADGVIVRNTPERCPSPLYSQDWPEGNVPEIHQGEELTNNKVEDEAEEEWMRGDHPCMREVKEEIPEDVTSENPSRNAWGNFMLLPNYKVEEEDITPHFSGENLLTFNVHPGLYSTDLSYNNPFNHKEPSDQLQIVTTKTDPRNVKGFFCDVCGRPFTTKSALVRHRKSHTGEKLYSCSECGKYFTSNFSLVKHERLHTGEKPYSCSECGKCFTTKSYLVLHEKLHTGENSCSECGKCFTSKSYLVLHEKRHIGESLFTCSECGKGFTSKSDIVKHERIHTGEKPYSCSECGKCFAQKSCLVIHERLHRGEKPYSCSECGKCFAHNSNLIKHVRGHTGEKPYACSECEKCFQRKSNLVKHMRIHTGEKPYSCSECGKCFAQKSCLVIHERIHTGEKPYSCSECGKCLKSKFTLIKHKRIHTRAKPYSCPVCGKCFINKSQLYQHKRSHTKDSQAK